MLAMPTVFLFLLSLQLSHQLECFQCNTVSVGKFSGEKAQEVDKCGGYEDLGSKVTCEDPRAFCYQEYYYRKMNYQGKAQTDVLKWDRSNDIQPDSPRTPHQGYERGIPAGSVWRGCRVPYDDVTYEETVNSHCQNFYGEWETNFNRYWLGSECYCDKDLCNSGRKLGPETLAALAMAVIVFNY